MWKRRNRQRSQTAASAASVPAIGPTPPPLPSPPSVQVPSAAPSSSPSTQIPPRAPSLAEPRLSPLQMTFDFEIAKPATKNGSGQPPVRPKTSGGVAVPASDIKPSTLSLLPPILPPIPRVASKEDGLNSAALQDSKISPGLKARDDSDNVSRISQATKKPWLSFFNRSNDSLPVLRPQTSAGGLSATQDTRSTSRPSTSGGSSTAKMHSTFLAKDDLTPTSKLLDNAPRMEATMFPKVAPVTLTQNTASLSPSTNKSFMESRDNQSGNKPPPRRPANIQTGADMPLAPPASNLFASPVALPSPNMLSAPSPMSINFNTSLREKRMTMMSTASGMSLRAPSISGMRLSPASSRISVAPKSPTFDAGHLSPATSSFGLNGINTPRKSISGARLSPQSSMDTLRKDASPDRHSNVRKSWLAPAWTFEGDDDLHKPPPIPESLHERPGSSGSLVDRSLKSGGPTSMDPAPFELQRTQTNGSSKSVKLPPHPSVYYEPSTVPDKRPPRRASRTHLLSPKSFPDLRDTSSPVPSLSEVSGAATSPITKATSSPVGTTAKRSRKSTIGTPYAATSDAYPMPQKVAVRPQNEGSMSTVGGTLVPTHYTSSSTQPEKVKGKQAKVQKEKEKAEMSRQIKAKLEKDRLEQAKLIKQQEEMASSEKSKADSEKRVRENSVDPKQEKVERRKTRLLNPMALLSRKRSALPAEIAIKPSSEEKSEQAQAFARQKSVAAIGVEKLPANYDPRIKGKRVHEFGTPSRQSTRNFSYNEQDWEAERTLGDRDQQTSGPALQYDPPPHENSPRRSVHSPHFREMFDDFTQGEHQPNSVQAEKLENKDFLQRASRQSTATTLSQESAVLPPFARRSQQSQLDAAQTNLVHETESKRSSNPSTVSHSMDRSSALSGVSMVSPITQRSSNVLADMRNSGSPMSPSSPSNKSSIPFSADVQRTRPTSSGSRMHIQPLSFGTIIEQPSTDALRTSYNLDSQPRPSVSLPIPEAASPSTLRPILFQRDSAQAPEAIVFPTREDSKSPVPPTEDIGTMAGDQQGQIGFAKHIDAAPSKVSSITTPASSPEVFEGNQETITVLTPAGAPRMVEKRASATGHSQRGSLLPQHQSSNASRFSFQFGGSAQEEEALEEKHRKIATSSGEVVDSTNSKAEHDNGDDDDDSFDEDAINDMDELELREQKGDAALMPAALMPAVLTLQQARQQLQVAPSSSSGSVDDSRRGSDDGEDVTYADHPAYRAYAAMNSTENGSTIHSRQASGASSSNHGAWRDNDILRYIDGYSSHHLRDLSEASVLTVNTNVVHSPTRDVQSSLQSHDDEPQDSTLSDQDRASSPRLVSALSTIPVDTPDKHTSTLSSFTVKSAETSVRSEPRIASPSSATQNSRPDTATKSYSPARSSGLALSALEELNFGDGPDLSIAGSRSLSPEQHRNANRRTKDSETIPDWRSAMSHPYSSGDNSSGRNTQSPGFSAHDRNSHQSAIYVGAMNKGIRVRESSNDRALVTPPAGEDDMYFDDGGFEQDIKTKPSSRTALDEESLDEAFHRKTFVPDPSRGHKRDNSGMTVTGVGGDGPYPAFAMGANPAKALQRQSQLLLQDLPMQEAPLDTQLIPQRNPSEDAKRLGHSNRVPPLPVEPGGVEATAQMQSSLQAYHAALANAANRAAADGRFSRMPSGASSVAQSLSTTSAAGDGESSQVSKDDRSFYSRDEEGNVQVGAAPPHGLGLSHESPDGSRETHGSTSEAFVEKKVSYSPPKMSFDFGFSGSFDADDGLDETPGMHDDFETDDDVIAAANAEALANDDEGFYGHEFGFYAKARSSSNELEAINGGFFGEDGDDGLTRNRSLREPNLTPITERSEFSTRNSFIGLNHGSLFGTASAGPMSAGLFGPGSPALARFPVTPLLENEVTSFDQLRKLRADAFGDSNASSGSDSKGTPPNPYNTSPAQSARSSAAMPSYFNSPTIPHFTLDNTSSSPASSSAFAVAKHSPQPSITLNHEGVIHSVSSDADATPRRPASTALSPSTAPKHARTGSDSVTYVQEDDPSDPTQPRWVLERRRTSEQGLVELVGREVVQNGWI